MRVSEHPAITGPVEGGGRVAPRRAGESGRLPDVGVRTEGNLELDKKGFRSSLLILLNLYKHKG